MSRVTNLNELNPTSLIEKNVTIRIFTMKLVACRQKLYFTCTGKVKRATSEKMFIDRIQSLEGEFSDEGVKLGFKRAGFWVYVNDIVSIELQEENDV